MKIEVKQKRKMCFKLFNFIFCGAAPRPYF